MNTLDNLLVEQYFKKLQVSFGSFSLSPLCGLLKNSLTPESNENSKLNYSKKNVIKTTINIIICV